jgi:hypothetical protein
MSEQRIYKAGDKISLKDKGEFEVVEDLGDKIMIRRKGYAVKLIIKKDRIL